MSATAIVGATVVTCDEEAKVIHDGTVVIDGTTILDVGPRDAVATNGATLIHARGAILHPALINAHAHLAMTIFRGAADDRDLQGFLERIFPLEAHHCSEASIAAGVRLAIGESFLAGCTSALDMYFWPDVAQAVAAEAGFRLHNGPVFMGFPTPDCPSVETQLERFTASPSPWIVAHGTYTLSVEELTSLAALRLAHAARFTIHAAENAGEVATVLEKTQKTPVALLDDLGLLGPHSVLAHVVTVTDEEIARLGATATIVAHCPLSNLKLASGICRTPQLIAAGATVALGTDGPASSDDLDLYTAMRFAALIARGATGDATALSAREVLEMATINGARALGLADTLGSITPGKDADLVLLDGQSAALTPSVDPIASIVYAASRADVRDVWAKGRQVVANRQLTTIDLGRAVAEVRELVATWRGSDLA